METSSKIVIVTGSNKGIGYALMQRLVKHAPRLTLVLTSRDESLGKEAVNNLIKEEPKCKDSLHYHPLDITNKVSRDKFKEWVQQTFGKFDVLVNNAGALVSGELYNPEYIATTDDVEKVIGTNYQSTRALTETLLPLLASDGKIISVSSAVAAWNRQGEPLLKIFTKPDFEDKSLEEIYTLFKEAVAAKDYKEKGFVKSPYMLSKALLNAWTYYVLQRSLSGDQQAFTMTPGHCRTDMGGDKALRSADDGADTIEYLIVDVPFKFDKEISGKFFAERKVVDFVEGINL